MRSLDCINGQHEPACQWCDCACHLLRALSAAGPHGTPTMSDEYCVDCGTTPCSHPTRHRGMDLLAVVVMAAFMFIIGLALGVMVSGW